MEPTKKGEAIDGLSFFYPTIFAPLKIVVNPFFLRLFALPLLFCGLIDIAIVQSALFSSGKKPFSMIQTSFHKFFPV